METLEGHIDSLQTKLQALLKRMGSLQKENELLSKEVLSLRQEEKSREERIESLEMKLSVLRASTQKLEGAEKADFEKRINRFIKDLDQCISILNT